MKRLNILKKTRKSKNKQILNNKKGSMKKVVLEIFLRKEKKREHGRNGYKNTLHKKPKNVTHGKAKICGNW